MPQEQYPEYILEKVRQRHGYDEDDHSFDAEIQAMPPSAVFDAVCSWEGLLGYGSTIRSWIRDIYGIELG